MADRFGSVRVRVTAAATVVVLALLAITAVLLVRVHRALLVENVDEQLEVVAERFEEAVERGDRLGEIPFGDDDGGYQVVDDGTVVEASEALAGLGPVTDRAEGTEELGLPDGDDDEDEEVEDETVRVLSTTADGLVLHAVASLEDVEESAAALAGTLAVAVPAITVVLGVGIWLLVERALRPVEAMRIEVAAIGGNDLHRRVPEPRGDDEVARLARTMNEMLERVEAARDRQQRFVADASHELRSPLTRMRTELEVDRAHPGRADPAATGASVLEEVVGLQRIVEDLLHLARSDSGAAPGPTEPVALEVIVGRAADDLRAATALTVDTSGVQQATVAGRPEALRRLVANLLDNAGRHAATNVRISLDQADGTAVLSVADDGSGVAPADRARIFERFTRLDAARTGATGGTGLGLAIVQEVTAQHGGTIAVDEAPGGGARFVVTLPLA